MLTLKPSDVIELQSSRQYPWRGLLGCAEFEEVARQCCEWLAANGDHWHQVLPIESLADEWDLNHGHPFSGNHSFTDCCMELGMLSERLIKILANNTTDG